MKRRFTILIVLIISLMLAGCAVSPEVIDTAVDNSAASKSTQPTEEQPSDSSDVMQEDETPPAADSPLTKEETPTEPVMDAVNKDEVAASEKDKESSNPSDSSPVKPTTQVETKEEESQQTVVYQPKLEAPVEYNLNSSSQLFSITDEEMALIMQELYKQGKLDPSSDSSITLTEQELNSLLNKVREQGSANKPSTPEEKEEEVVFNEKKYYYYDSEDDTDATPAPTTNTAQFEGLAKPIIPDEPDPTPEPRPQISASVSSSIGSSILSLVNEYRAQVGAEPLSYSSAMQSAANARAQECITSFSHTRPDGSGASSVMAEYGVSYSGFGENLFYASGVSSVSASTVTSAWMNSSGHRANILEPRFTSMCIGTAVDGDTIYVVQLFAA